MISRKRRLRGEILLRWRQARCAALIDPAHSPHVWAWHDTSELVVFIFRLQIKCFLSPVACFGLVKKNCDAIAYWIFLFSIFREKKDPLFRKKRIPCRVHFRLQIKCFFGRRGDVFAAPTRQERKARAKEAQKRMCSLQGIADQRSTCNLHSSSKTEPCSLVRSNEQEAREPRPPLLKWSTRSAAGDFFLR